MPGFSLSVPHFKQEFPYSCVAACVRLVLAHHGRTLSELEVRQLLGTSPHGTPARAILLVTTLNFDVQLTTTNTTQLASALATGNPPIVLDTAYLDYWQIRANHVAVLVGIDSETVYLNRSVFSMPPLNRTSLAGFERALGRKRAVRRPD